MEIRKDSFAAGPAPRVVIECEHGTITVRAGSGTAVSVETALRRPELFDYEAVSDDETVRITVKAKAGLPSLAKLFSWPREGPRADITVTMPPGATIETRGANATADVEGASGGVDVSLSNGRARIRRCGGDVRVKTSNGSVDLDDVDGRISARATNGSINGRGLAGSLDIRTTNGRVDVEFDPSPGSRSSAATTNGSLSIGLARDDVAVNVATTHGAASIEMPWPSEASPGRPSLEVRSTNGKVRVYRAEPLTMRF